jgi:methyl-accepting chemotaxis protein
LRKLTGNTDIEDSLERLDKLTQEEARMASAELLEITHSIDDRVKDVSGDVQDVGNKVQDVDHRVQSIGSNISSRVQGVHDGLDRVNRSLSL